LPFRFEKPGGRVFRPSRRRRQPQVATHRRRSRYRIAKGRPLGPPLR
jgi:hypothetical protein